MRDNGAIEGAADGFEADDEVIVMQHKDGSVIKVLGHVDGVVKCRGEYLIIYLIENTKNTYIYGQYCTVWDIKKNCLADKVTLNTSTEEDPQYASFPCLASSISDWLNLLTVPEVRGGVFRLYGEDARNYHPTVVPPLPSGGFESASGSGSQPSYPTLLGTTDTSEGIYAVTIDEYFEGFINGRWTVHIDYTIVETDHFRVYGLWSWTPGGKAYYPGPMTFGVQVDPYFTDHAGDVYAYQLYWDFIYNQTKHYVRNDNDVDFDDALYDETLTYSNEIQIKTPFQSIVSKTVVVTANIHTVDIRIPEPRVYENTQAQSENAVRDVAFGHTDYYTKNNIVHIANVSISTYLATSPPGTVVFSIEHHAEAYTLSCNDTSVIDPLSATRNSALETALLSLLNIQTPTGGTLTGLEKLYRVYGEVKKSA